MTTIRPSREKSVSGAVEACRSFAQCSGCFFTRETAWRGWENWLTVEIVRCLNHPAVIPFARYPAKNGSMDIGVGNPLRLAVEIKVNYITDAEAGRLSR